MFGEIFLGILHASVTVLIHGVAMLLVTRRVRHVQAGDANTMLWLDFIRIAYVVAMVFLATVFEAAWWAMNYVYVGALESFEEAMYFSMVTYTTLGYGDITLNENWRLLSAFQAANGIIIAGWSTALVIAAIQQIYKARHSTD
jgi:hypothetical protein